MSQDILRSSQHFRASLGVLEERASQEFAKWAAANCRHHVMREEGGVMVLYATRQNCRSEQQHKNAVKALASNKRIKLNTEASFLRLLQPEEYDAIAREAPDTDGHDEAPTHQESPPACGAVEIVPHLPTGFDARAKEAYLALVAVDAR